VPRVRVGVVLLVPPPLDRELNALRRAMGDGTYGRVPVHLTLVPPVNLNQDRMTDALRVLREAAVATQPITVHLGPPATFLPANPVLYLPLVGPGRAAVFDLRQRVFRDPLARPLSWPFVPHVTLADEVQPERIAAAEAALCDYAAEVSFDRVHLLQEMPGRVWQPVADARFAPPAVIGRGGLPLEVQVVGTLDPEARDFSEVEGAAELAAEGLGEESPDIPDLAVVARREGTIVGTAEGWARAGVAYLARLVVAREVRDEGVGSHLVAAYETAAVERDCVRLGAGAWAGSATHKLLEERGWVEEARLSPWHDERDFVYLRRDL
jgi:2'-5' RNA ligase/GNAT superfamily N-acetyltransferase